MTLRFLHGFLYVLASSLGQKVLKTGTDPESHGCSVTLYKVSFTLRDIVYIYFLG